jgi:hypothetical protein
MRTTPESKKKVPRQVVTLPLAVSESSHGLLDTSAAAGIPAMPLFGVLPLRRLIPQDLHSVLDYQGALSVLGVGLLTGCALTRSTQVALGSAGLGVSLFTDYRLSLRKVIPIEVHEFIDHAWSLGVIAAPFVLGYARRHPVVAALNVLVGVTTILGSLLTDYRAQKGVKWSRGSVTDLGPVGA